MSERLDAIARACAQAAATLPRLTEGQRPAHPIVQIARGVESPPREARSIRARYGHRPSL